MLFETYFLQYLEEFKELKTERWNYHWGCVLTGSCYLYIATGNEAYLKPVLNFGEKYVDATGRILGFHEEDQNVDTMASGRLLYFLYDYTKEEKYLKGIHLIRNALDHQPRTSTGNFWHKKIYPFQIWLDGLYMVQPLYMEYEKRFRKKEGYKDSLSQFQNARNFLYDPKKHLCYHAYDEKRVMIWADKDTGRSPNFWLRSMGWYLLALSDCYEICEDFDAKAVLGSLLKEAIEGIVPYQNKKSGLFYQLIDLPDEPENYLETSGSAMISYSILKACRLGVLDKETFFPIGEQILAALGAEKFTYDSGKLHLTGTCASAGLGPKDERDGSVAYYLSEAVKDDNPHGVAACMMAFSEWLRAVK